MAFECPFKNSTSFSFENFCPSSLKVTLPWVVQEFYETREIMGKNFWPYGIEENRKELELVMRYAYEQGLVKRQVKFEEMFDPSTLDLIEEW